MKGIQILSKKRTKPPERVPAPAATGPVAVLRRYPVPLAITLLVLAGALAGPAALADPATGGGVPASVSLKVGFGYVLLAPILNVMDTLSLQTLGQHYAFLISLILLYAGWRILRKRTARELTRRAAIEAGVAVLALAGLLAFYGYGMVGPRPMAGLVVSDPGLLAVDMHSHTGASHDVRDSFTAESNRAWHEAAGFHAAYVSDHRTWDGAAAATQGNPSRAGQGVVLLPAVELKYKSYYASILGDACRYWDAIEGNDLLPDPLHRDRAERPEPTLILTLPETLEGVPEHDADSLGFVAIEINDASPRGLRQSRRDRERILYLADSLDLALVAASNNHGWGRTAAAWTLVHLPDWRSLAPDRLGRAIEQKLHRDRRYATTVVERRMPYAGESPLQLAATLPAMTWQMFGGIGARERASWLAWTWGLALLVGALARGRASVPRPVRSAERRAVLESALES